MPHFIWSDLKKVMSTSVIFIKFESPLYRTINTISMDILRPNISTEVMERVVECNFLGPKTLLFSQAITKTRTRGKHTTTSPVTGIAIRNVAKGLLKFCTDSMF